MTGNEITVDVGRGARRYRAVHVGETWPRSAFEYWNPIRQEWRAVRSWDSREKLFACWRQISAAPDMLSTLRAVRSSLMVAGYEEKSLLIEAVSASIAKAEGTR